MLQRTKYVNYNIYFFTNINININMPALIIVGYELAHHKCHIPSSTLDSFSGPVLLNFKETNSWEKTLPFFGLSSRFWFIYISFLIPACYLVFSYSNFFLYICLLFLNYNTVWITPIIWIIRIKFIELLWKNNILTPWKIHYNMDFQLCFKMKDNHTF